MLSHPLEGEGLASKSACTERLTYGFSTPDHPVGTKGVRFVDIDGRPMLVLSDIGMWRPLIERMFPTPDSSTRRAWNACPPWPSTPILRCSAPT